MKFFSGFCLDGEAKYFDRFTKKTEFDVNGFSYGAIKAYEYALERVKQGKRVNSLTLLSPAFFQDKEQQFKRLQILGFKKNPTQYIQNFLSICDMPQEMRLCVKNGDLEELEELINYTWDEGRIKELQSYGVKIDIFIGGRDKIISTQKVFDFFTPFANVYLYKTFGHCLTFCHL